MIKANSLHAHFLWEFRMMPFLAHHVEAPQILLIFALLGVGGWLGWMGTSLIMGKIGSEDRALRPKD